MMVFNNDHFFVFILFKTSSLVLCSFHDILKILLYNHISNASTLSNATLVNVHVSAPHIKVLTQVKHFAMRDLNSMLVCFMSESLIYSQMQSLQPLSFC